MLLIHCTLTSTMAHVSVHLLWAVDGKWQGGCFVATHSVATVLSSEGSSGPVSRHIFLIFPVLQFNVFALCSPESILCIITPQAVPPLTLQILLHLQHSDQIPVPRPRWTNVAEKSLPITRLSTNLSESEIRRIHSFIYPFRCVTSMEDFPKMATMLG